MPVDGAAAAAAVSSFTQRPRPQASTPTLFHLIVKSFGVNKPTEADRKGMSRVYRNIDPDVWATDSDEATFLRLHIPLLSENQTDRGVRVWRLGRRLFYKIPPIIRRSFWLLVLAVIILAFPFLLVALMNMTNVAWAKVVLLFLIFACMTGVKLMQ